MEDINEQKNNFVRDKALLFISNRLSTHGIYEYETKDSIEKGIQNTVQANEAESGVKNLCPSKKRFFEGQRFIRLTIS